MAAPDGQHPTKGRTRAIVLAALAGVLLGGLAGGGGYLLTRHGDGKQPAAASGPTAPATSAAPGSPSPTVPPPAAPVPTASATATATPTETPTPTPTGPHRTFVQDRAGFGLLVPDGWQRRPDDGGKPVFYDSPDRLSLVQVIPMGPGDPYAHAVDTDADLVKQNRPDYHRIRLVRTADGAELEYAYTLDGHVRLTVNHILTAPDGNDYALLVAGPEDSWPSTLRSIQQSVLSSFCLTDHCPTPPPTG
ncbi:hypothetical protein [Kitasatospora sp. NPDC097643]|uniref:hypothetical protein n=1 Tax=Kitasatospora sp. NPDC097643 TaxID=3157230 RepID=UPI003319F348